MKKEIIYKDVCSKRVKDEGTDGRDETRIVGKEWEVILKIILFSRANFSSAEESLH